MKFKPEPLCEYAVPGKEIGENYPFPYKCSVMYECRYKRPTEKTTKCCPRRQIGEMRKGRYTMNIGKELLKEIDEHLQSGKGRYHGLELSDFSLRFIRKLLEAQEELIDVGILEHKEYCPSCGKRIRGKYCIGGRVYTPPFCCLCGKPLKPEKSDSPSEKQQWD